MPEANSFTTSGQEATIRGDNFRLEFDASDGTIFARTEGAMIGVFRGLDIHDFILRFNSDFQNNPHYDELVDWLVEHKDAFVTGNEAPNVFKGDNQRYRFDPYTYNEEADRMIRKFAEEENIELGGLRKEFKDKVSEEIMWDTDERKAWELALEDVGTMIQNNIEQSGFRDVLTRQEDWMRKVHERSMNHHYEVMPDYDVDDMYEHWNETLEENSDKVSQYRVTEKPDGDGYRLRKIGGAKNIRVGTFNQVSGKAEEIAENNSPAYVEFHTPEGEMESKMY